MRTSTFLRPRRTAAMTTSAETKSAAIESPAGNPAAVAMSPASTASVPTKSLAKWRAFALSASLRYRRAPRATRSSATRRSASTSAIAVKVQNVGSTSKSTTPASRKIAVTVMSTLTATRKAASASAARFCAFPCPYGCPRSAGRTATETAKNVSSAAARSVPECAASARRPRLELASPAASLIAMRRQAAPTETRAVRRCGDMRRSVWPALVSRRLRRAPRCRRRPSARAHREPRAEFRNRRRDRARCASPEPRQGPREPRPVRRRAP